MELKEVKELINSINDTGPKRVFVRYIDSMGQTCEVEIKQIVEESVLGKDGEKRVILKT